MGVRGARDDDMSLVVRYLRERMPAALFAPIVAALSAVSLGAAGRSDLRTILWGPALMLLLVVQFRLWDDLADAGADRIRHPERLLPRVPHGPFWLFEFLAAAAALSLAAASAPSLLALVLLNVAFLIAYRVRRHLKDHVWRYGVLLLKYPAFVAIVALGAGAAPSNARLAMAAAAAYLGAAAYEALHTLRPPRGATAGPMRVAGSPSQLP